MSVTRRNFVKLTAGALSATWMMNRRGAQAQIINAADKANSPELVYLDQDGVIRWKSDDGEVALFGANYCLPSASDYRMAGAVGADRKPLIEKDMAHFARMGWDGLRLCFWGDWENSDKAGNLLVNDHLDLLDYLIAQATQRGIFMLLSPIATYTSFWPDLKDDPAVIGFSRQFTRLEMGESPEAIAAQVNYLRQLLSHVNPYTQRALKDEPNLLMIEMINEPRHHSDNFEVAVKYINALVDAVRNVGCDKLTFHNVSQDFGMAKPIWDSRVQGSSFAWYPSGLDGRGRVRGNYLKSVDEYPRMLNPDLAKKAKLVYEFDMPDVTESCYYPAMARTFKSVGAQFAAIFVYDMLATAPYNLVWKIHNLNMVYTPQKAVSAIIAGEVLKSVPRLQPQGAYPHNARFGAFRVSYQEDLSEMVTAQVFMYSNNTKSRPKSLATLRQIVGYGSSPVVRYDGQGLYFLDKIEDGVWRLEVYPDAVQVNDPYLAPTKDKIVSRLVKRQWPMQIRLPDLSGSFEVAPLNQGNSYHTQSKDGRFVIAPGVFLLKANTKTAQVTLPEKIGHVGLREFFCPAEIAAPPNIVATAQQEFPADQPMRFAIEVVGSEPVLRASVLVRPSGRTEAQEFPLRYLEGYNYGVSVAPRTFPAGPFDYWFRIQSKTQEIAHPPQDDDVAAVLTAHIVAPDAALALFKPSEDLAQLDLSRSLRRPWGEAARAPVFRFRLPDGFGWVPDDLTASLYIGDRIAQRGAGIVRAKALVANVKTDSGAALLHLTLIEKDGTAWSAPIQVTAQQKAVVLPLAQMKPSQ